MAGPVWARPALCGRQARFPIVAGRVMQSVGRSSGDPIASLTRQAATERRSKRLPRLFTPIAAALSLNHCTGHRHSDPVSDGGADNAYHKRFDGAVTLSGLELPCPSTFQRNCWTCEGDGCCCATAFRSGRRPYDARGPRHVRAPSVAYCSPLILPRSITTDHFDISFATWSAYSCGVDPIGVDPRSSSF